jgi:hypothetical protein
MKKTINTAKLSISEPQFQNSELNGDCIPSSPRTAGDFEKKMKTLDFQKWRGQNQKLNMNREQRTREQFTL